MRLHGQAVKTSPFHGGNTGSIPVGVIYGLVAQLVRAPPCHGGGRRFESDLGRLWMIFTSIINGILAQLGEHLPYKQRVTGSSPVGPIFYSILMMLFLCNRIFLWNYLLHKKAPWGCARICKWSMSLKATQMRRRISQSDILCSFIRYLNKGKIAIL